MLKNKVKVVFLLLVVFIINVMILTNSKETLNNKILVGNQNKSIYQTNISKDELLTLVNYENEIPKDWNINLISLDNNQSVDSRIYNDLMSMLQAAKNEGLNLLICSSYRTSEKQNELYQRKVKEYLNKNYSMKIARTKASFWVAKPGTSEHQLGLAVDIVSKDNQRLDESQVETQEQQWLMQNSWKYGFILRYPPDKKDITKVGYEPWHYRYVGKEHAKIINEKNICLEQYITINNNE